MSTDRAELHRLVDELDEERVTEARAALQALTPEQVPAQPRRRLSLSGAYRSGH
jgi:Spy/CpxP family protein refolding chaperone